MRFAGIVPEDAPDPRVEAWRHIGAMPVPVVTIVPQPALRLGSLPSVAIHSDARGVRSMDVSLSYLVVRDSDTPSDPDGPPSPGSGSPHPLEGPPWPRPAWLIELAEEMLYRQLWEAVRTSWHREEDEHATLEAVLLAHVNHVLRNRFREERRLGGHFGGVHDAPDVTASAIQRDTTVEVDGVPLEGLLLDTDPHVFALAAALPSGGTLSAVIPREDLPLVRLAFQTHRA